MADATLAKKVSLFIAMNCPPIEKVRSVAQSVGILHPTGTIKYEYEYVDYYEYRYHRQLRNIFVGTLDN